MKHLKGNLLYGQSGGPTSIINSSAYGIIKSAIRNNKYIKETYIMHYGLEGLLNEDLIKIDKNKDYSKLINTPGAFFGSNRYKLKDYKEDETDYIKIYEILKKYNIKYIFYNGGNDSMDTINKIGEYLLSKNYEIKVFGIPKTIDNDLNNNYFSLGFISAAKFIINSLLEIYYDDKSYKTGRVNIVETMGRNAGWLTASSLYLEKLGAKVDLVYVPELTFNEEEFLTKVKEIYSKNKHCLIVVSEGIKDKNNNFIFEANANIDQFNHNSLGGVSSYLAKLVESKLNYKVRGIELSLLQRASSLTLSKFEVDCAIKLSDYLVDLAINSDLNRKIGTIVLNENDEIDFSNADLQSVANFEKKLHEQYIDFENKTLKKDEIIKYLDRLLKGSFNTLNELGFIDTYKCNLREIT